jgi:hypothetical protein
MLYEHPHAASLVAATAHRRPGPGACRALGPLPARLFVAGLWHRAEYHRRPVWPTIVDTCYVFQVVMKKFFALPPVLGGPHLPAVPAVPGRDRDRPGHARVQIGTLRGADATPRTAVSSHLVMLGDLLGVPRVINVFRALSFGTVLYLLLTALFVLGVHRPAGRRLGRGGHRPGPAGLLRPEIAIQLVLAAAFLAVVLGVAALSYRIVERPMQLLAHRVGSAWTHATAATGHGGLAVSSGLYPACGRSSGTRQTLRAKFRATGRQVTGQS